MSRSTSLRLEPVFLANVLLFIPNYRTIQLFPFVSKNCHEATLTLKTNPAAFSFAPREILALFPNINTMVLRWLWSFEDTDTLPDSVTAIVLEDLDHQDLIEQQLPFADRIVAIRSSARCSEGRADFSRFPNLERLTLDVVPCQLTLPTHRLKRLTVHVPGHGLDPLVAFPPECAEQIVVVCPTQSDFIVAKRRSPPNVRVLCSSIGEGVTPADVFPPALYCSLITVTLSDGFGADELRAFNEALPILSSTVQVEFETACAARRSPRGPP